MISTVYVAKNVYGGDGLGRLGDGRVVFVPGAWEGEHVRAEITAEKRGFVRSRLVEVVEPSPERISSDPASGIPGCVYAGLSAAGEMRAKERQLKEFFERARIPVGNWNVSPLGEDGFYNYRNKVVYHFGVYDGCPRLGYRREPSHAIIDIESDPLAVAAINAKLPQVRRTVFTLATSGPSAVRRDVVAKGNVTVRWSEKSGVNWWIGDAPEGLLFRETTCGLEFDVPAGGFYQVNPRVGEDLVKAVRSEYRKDPSGSADVLDLYCGVGVFGLCLKPPELTGVESGRAAVDFARRNAKRQQMPHARFFSAQVGRSTGRIKTSPSATVIVDPPRGGLEKGVAGWLAKCGARRIFYVSCDGATLVRDLKELRGAYDVASVTMFNMFPKTARFETFAVLERRNRT